MRIILADDQRDVRSGLKILLEQETQIDIVGEAAELSSLVIQIHKNKPDLILLDCELGNLNISDIMPVLRLMRQGLKIIGMSGRPEARKAALNAGVDMFVSKGDHPEKLLDAIRKVCSKTVGEV